MQQTCLVGPCKACRDARFAEAALSLPDPLLVEVVGRAVSVLASQPVVYISIHLRSN